MKYLSFCLILFLLPACQESTENCDEEPLAWYITDTTDMGVIGEQILLRNPFGIGFDRGVVHSEIDTTDGYILFPESQSRNVYLINRNGKVVHKWRAYFEVLGGYLLEDGSLIVNASDPDKPRFFGGGATGRILRYDWDGKLLWNYEMASWDELHHHDFEVLPNGNILAIAWEYKSEEESLAAGRSPEYVGESGLWPDKIVELQPDGKYGAKVVWEWHIWDHLIQDYDPNKANYGVVSEHPELIDINAHKSKVKQIHPDSIQMMRDSLEAKITKGRANRYAKLGMRASDIFHLNAVDYNAELDQIAISSPEISEIIDHSTTTEEAKGHTGGRYGRGGDILYRYGNPANYHLGDSTDRELYYQHNIQWIEDGYPGEGNLILYNNNIPKGNLSDSIFYSGIQELKMQMDPNGRYAQSESGEFMPEQPEWSFIHEDTLSMWSPFISGVQRLKSGNTFITEGAEGRFLEVTPDGKVVWEYLNPFVAEPAEEIVQSPNGTWSVFMVFRSVFYPKDYPAFEGKELKPLEDQPEATELPFPELKIEPKDTTTMEASLR